MLLNLDTTDINNETARTMTIRNATLADNNTRYRCIATNRAGFDTSDYCTLTVIDNQRPPEWVRDTMHTSVIEKITYSISLPDSCTDPNGDILTFSLITGSPTGDTITSSKHYIYTPGFTDAGIYYIKLRAHDGTDSSSALLQLTVLDSNRIPKFKDSLPMPSYRIKDGELLTMQLAAEDADGDSVSVLLDSAATTLLHKERINLSNTQLTWQSEVGDSGLFDVKLGATDKKDTGWIIVQVAIGANLPPIVSINGYSSGETATVTEKVELALKVEATDPDSGQTAVLLPAKNLPGGSTFDTATGDFAYTADFNISNQQTNTTFSNITFYATDNMSKAIDSFIIHIQVLDSNRAPSVKDTSITAQEKVSTPVNIYTTDPDGDAMTWTISQAPKLGSADVSNGSISNTTHEFSYTSNNLTSTDHDTIQVTVSDGEDQSVMKIFITIQANNAPPVIDNVPTVDAVEDNTTAYPINIAGHDPEGSAVKWYVHQLPKKGTLDKLEGDITTGIEMQYTLKPDSCGKDSLTFYLLDPEDNSSDTQSIQITIDSVNDAPVINGQIIIPNGDEDNNITLQLSHLNVTDVDNPVGDLNLIVIDDNNYSIVSGTTIKPDQDFNGSLTVQVKVSDGVAESITFGMNVTVNPVNDAPVVDGQNTTPSCNEDNNLTLQLAHLDVTDVDNGAGDLNLIVIDDANYSVVSGTTIRPDQDYNGSLTVKVKVRDLEDESAVFDMSVTVNPVNDKPEITISNYNSSQPYGTAVNIETSFSDVDGNIDSIFYLVDSQVDYKGPVSNSPHQHNWTATYGPYVIGPHNVKAIIKDSTGEKDTSQTVFVNITGTLESDTLSVWGILNTPGQVTYVTAISEVTTISNGRIQTLEFHSAWGTEISILTPHVGNLSQLENLICDDCGINNLPSDIGRLNNLTYLETSGCGLSSLPNEIVNLTSLTYLDLNFNNLTDLPNDIVNLVNVAVNDLDLADNLLTPYPNPPEPWEQWATDRDPDWRTTQRSR
jgi:VCBS repeat-containing protein